MLHINLANVFLNMLIVSFQISNIPQTPINEKEIELHDTIKDIIKISMNDVSFTMQTSTLEFENYWDLNLSEAKFVTDEKLEENDKNEEKYNCTCTSEENEIINNDYK